MIKNKFIGKLVIALVVALIGLAGVFFAKPGVIVNNIISPSSSSKDDDGSAKADSKETYNKTLPDEVIRSFVAKKPENIELERKKPAINEESVDTHTVSEVESNEPVVSDQIVESGMITFTLTKVSLSGQTLKFDFIVENNDEDRHLTLASARIIDNEGIAFSTKEISIARTSAFQFDLPVNIPVHMEVMFDRINKEINAVSFFELKGYVYGRKRQPIEVTMKNLSVD